MKKTFPLVILFLVMCATSVLADWQDNNNCFVGTRCNLQRLVVDNNLTNVTGASCNATIRNTTTQLIANQPMFEISAGYYATNFTPNHTGIYPSTMRCAFTNQMAVADLTFVAEMGVSKFMGFELAIPMFLYGLAVLCVWGFVVCKKDRPGMFHITLQHALILGATLFVLVGTITIKHLIDYENTASNATLTSLSNLIGVVYVGFVWITVAVVATIVISFAIRAILLFKENAMEVNNRKKEKKYGPSWKELE